MAVWREIYIGGINLFWRDRNDPYESFLGELINFLRITIWITDGATNKKLVTFLFWTPTKTNYLSQCSNFHKNLIDTITSNNFYLKFKENNENYMAAQIFGLFFITADGRAKLAQQQFSTMLPFHPLYFPWFELVLNEWIKFWRIKFPEFFNRYQ